MGKMIPTKDYAKQVGVDRSVVLRKIYSGLLKAEKIGTIWLIDSDQEWVDMRTKDNSRRWHSSEESPNDGINKPSEDFVLTEDKLK